MIKVGKKFINNFAQNMELVIMSNDGYAITDFDSDNLVTDVNVGTGIITLSDDLIESKADYFYVYNAKDDQTSMNGIDTVFLRSFYGTNIIDNPEIAPCEYRETSNELRVLDEESVLDFLDAYEEHCQSMPADILLTHPRVKKSIFESLKSTRSNIATTELAGGFHGFTFNGIPLYSDVKCKAGNLYALNSKSFAMHQLCDWTWLSNEDGSILKQQPGKATYMATLVKYADLICDKPFLQGRCTGFSALKWKAE